MKTEMWLKTYRIPTIKAFRTLEVLRDYICFQDSYDGIVMFSSGKAYEWMKKLADFAGIDVLGISSSIPFDGAQKLENRFYSKEEIAELFPRRFDATPGALDELTMRQIGIQIYCRLLSLGYDLRSRLYVPVGSGETIISLAYRVPDKLLVGFTCDDYPPIRFDHSYLMDEVKTRFEVRELKGLKSISDASAFLGEEDSLLLTE
jgi:hypothetical protein